MKLYVIRHGESQGNVKRIYCGQLDTPLTELGRQQAGAAGVRLAGIPFDKVYASPLSRAYETAKLALPNMEPELDPALMEIDVGRLMGQNYDQCVEQMGKEFLNNKDEWDFTPYGGENKQMMMQRAGAFLAKIAARDDECVAAFCHAGMCCALLMAALNTPLDRYALHCDNTAIAVFEHQNGRWILQKWNFDGTV